jgi:hypothetical protein
MLHRLPQEQNITFANGDKAKVIAQCCVSIENLGRLPSHEIHLFVGNLPTHDVILGQPWFIQMNPDIDVRQCCISLCSKYKPVKVVENCLPLHLENMSIQLIESCMLNEYSVSESQLSSSSLMPSKSHSVLQICDGASMPLPLHVSPSQTPS